MKKRYIKQCLMAFYLSALVAACATSETEPRAETDLEYNGTDCISIRTIRDYTPLDNRNLLVEAAGRRHYLVTLVMTSFELRSSFRLGFRSRDDWLCPYGGDRIVFEGLANDEISIRSITRLTAEQTEDLLVRYGKKEPTEQQDPPPPDLKGAEVEELGSEVVEPVE